MLHDKDYYLKNNLTISETKINSMPAMDKLRLYDGTVFDPTVGVYRIFNGKLITAPDDERSVATDAK